jgi:hypothetical protein
VRFRSTLLAIGASLFLFQTSASAILFETGPQQRMGGYLVSEDAKQITVRFKTPGGKEKVQAFDRAKIKILHKVDLVRLEKLSKENPKGYQDYAKELAKEKADPEAVELALRLYLIAAYLDTPKWARDCLLGMSELAAGPADGRRYRALAFLLDSKEDPALLQEKKAGPLEAFEIKAAPTPLARFQKALERYRAGDIKKAKDDANEKGVADYFKKAGLDQRRFVQACDDAVCAKCKKAGFLNCVVCNGKGRVPDQFGGFQACTNCNGKGKQKCPTCDGTGLTPYPEDYLRTIIKAEVWALEQIVTVEPIAKKAPLSWDNALNNQQAAVRRLTLETITPYDPRQCLFRNGKWVAEEPRPK